MSSEELGGRVSKLEEDVSDLKVETAKIGTSLDALKETAAERHEDLKGSLTEIGKAVKAHDAHVSRHTRWLKEILTPQTVAIVLAILASAFGAPMMAQQIMGSAGIETEAPAPAEAEVAEAPAAEEAEEAAPVEEETPPEEATPE
jgi:hypothetical protein